MTTLIIKNMVCHRCILAVGEELKKLDISPVSIQLGEVELENELSLEAKKKLEINLQKIGFEIIDDKKSKLINKVKLLIIDIVQNKNNDLTINLSNYLSAKLLVDYSTLSNLFSEVENITIEKYFIEQKIEKVKELLMYEELTLSEIAYLLNYSSVAHLSSQFKKITGLSPSHFKKIKENKRKQIDHL